MAACTLCPTSWLGIYYMPSPTVTLNFINAALNQSAVTATIAGGATSYTVYDGAGTIVGAGTMSAADTAITPVSSGTFVGGAAVKPGFYTVATGSGTNLVVAGYFCICPSPTNLYVPVSAGQKPGYLAPWIGIGPDRDGYSYNPGGPSYETAAGIISTLQA